MRNLDCPLPLRRRITATLLPLLLSVPSALQAQAPASRISNTVRVKSLGVTSTASIPPSAYNDHPKLAIILVIDQFRGDYLDRYRADFKNRGFNLFLKQGAYFPDCYYDYANTKTAPGHATIGTGAYTDGHGISSNDWWDLARNTRIAPSPPLRTSATARRRARLQHSSQPARRRRGAKSSPASPRNLLASTVGDELRLATQGQAKVFGISLKDRAAILPAGATANGAYWIDPRLRLLHHLDLSTCRSFPTGPPPSTPAAASRPGRARGHRLRQQVAAQREHLRRQEFLRLGRQHSRG